MTISRLIDLWDQATECLDNAMDYSDYNLVNSIENYLDILSCEIECFRRQI